MAVTIRSFIAVHLTDTVREKITEFQSGLNKIGKGVKWVRPESMHITLKFLGNITPEQIESITDIIQDIAKPIDPFQIAIRGVGCFPNEKRPRILWLGIQTDHDALANMANGLDVALEKIGFDREKRSFKPHLTLGRIKSPDHVHTLIQRMNHYGFNSEPFQVASVDLMQSHLKPSGAEYVILKSIQL